MIFFTYTFANGQFTQCVLHWHCNGPLTPTVLEPYIGDPALSSTSLAHRLTELKALAGETAIKIKLIRN